MDAGRFRIVRQRADIVAEPVELLSAMVAPARSVRERSLKRAMFAAFDAALGDAERTAVAMAWAALTQDALFDLPTDATRDAGSEVTGLH